MKGRGVRRTERRGVLSLSRTEGRKESTRFAVNTFCFFPPPSSSDYNSLLHLPIDDIALLTGQDSFNTTQSTALSRKHDGISNNDNDNDNNNRET